MQIIILLGPPGSGKGTQAEKLKEKLHLPHISTGEILRENVRSKTSLGQKVSSYLDMGKLVPDEVVLDILFDRVTQADCTQGYILDGFPRTLPQAEALSTRLSPLRPLVFNFELNDEEIIHRLSKRRVCPACQSLYHLTYSPPQTDNLCDRCQTPLIQRSDDKEEVISNRLRVYHEQTAPLIQYYERQGLLHRVPCIGSKTEIFEKLLPHLS